MLPSPNSRGRGPSHGHAQQRELSAHPAPRAGGRTALALSIARLGEERESGGPQGKNSQMFYTQTWLDLLVHVLHVAPAKDSMRALVLPDGPPAMVARATITEH